jgi:hypothetical protein
MLPSVGGIVSESAIKGIYNDQHRVEMRAYARLNFVAVTLLGKWISHMASSSHLNHLKIGKAVINQKSEFHTLIRAYQEVGRVMKHTCLYTAFATTSVSASEVCPY